MEQYKLGTKFCRESHKSDGVSIFVHDTLQCMNINLDEFVRHKTSKHVQLRLTYYP